MTRLFGIIGHPIDHSLSPLMHEAAFRALRLDACYAAFDVPPRRLTVMLRALAACGLEGLNVTVPHKEAVWRFVARTGMLDATARAVGAVNTLRLRRGRWQGFNTDVEGFRRTLIEALRFRARGRRALVLGAGGAARAVVWALAQERAARIDVANRTRAHSMALARWLRRTTVGRGIEVQVVARSRGQIALHAREADLIVNATSLGLHASDPLPIDPRALSKGQRVVDLVYPAPREAPPVKPWGGVYRIPTTAFVAAATRRGALAVDGIPMLGYQGAAAFRLWWHRKPPVAVMRRALEQALSSRRDRQPRRATFPG